MNISIETSTIVINKPENSIELIGKDNGFFIQNKYIDYMSWKENGPDSPIDAKMPGYFDLDFYFNGSKFTLIVNKKQLEDTKNLLVAYGRKKSNKFMMTSNMIFMTNNISQIIATGNSLSINFKGGNKYTFNFSSNEVAMEWFHLFLNSKKGQ